MTQVVDEDFRAFVEARWPELEALARVVVLDPDLARTVTAEALSRLSTRWHAAVEQGRPGEDARRALLTGALAAVRPPAGRRLLLRRDAGEAARAATVAGQPAALVPAAAPWDDDEPVDPVVAAVLAALVAAEPLDRALVGAHLLWDARAHDVAHLLERPHGELAGRERAVELHLASVRTRAQRAAGRPEDPGWVGREHDVADAVAVLLHGQGDPPDPTALVVRRTGALRRRHVLLGGAAAALLGAGGAATVLLRDDPASRAGGPRPLPGPSDASWGTTQSWAARGPLADDPGVRALVRAPGQPPARILWAGDAADRRVVVAAKQGEVALVGTELLVWSGRRGDPTATLPATGLATPGVYGVADLVAVGLGGETEGDAEGPTGPTLLVVLGRPDLTAVGLSTSVLPRADGTVGREFREVPLRDGVATLALGRAAPGTLRIQHRYTEVQPASTAYVRTEVDGAGTPTTAWFEAGARRVVAQLTGLAPGVLTTEVVVDDLLPVSPIDGAAPGARAVVVHTRTPDGALLVSAAVLPAEGDLSFSPLLVRSASVVPADDGGAPFLTRVEDLRPGVGRFLVIAPGAARVQLISESASGYPVSKVVQTGGRSASVVELINADDASALRLIARDAKRRLLYDDVPADPPWLLGV